MVEQTILIDVPADFGFWPAAMSHGWCVLPPFSVDRKRRILSRIVDLGNQRLARVHLTSETGGQLSLRIQSDRRLGGPAADRLIAIVRGCLRWDESVSGLHALLDAEPEFQWVKSLKAGRLLRAPTVFEDVVKMILTTNCSWGQTERMTRNLVNGLGQPWGEGLHAFPGAEAIAECSVDFLTDEVRLGYRASYVRELASRVRACSLDVESWREPGWPAADLWSELLSVKGVGEYAALLRLCAV
ncbi:MAG: 3-methyladenine DNA glycosylase [Acidobacteria bacterium]|nr:3-methyladenine DNA glycosylase [Acidobacteriota bacterium]